MESFNLAYQVGKDSINLVAYLEVSTMVLAGLASQVVIAAKSFTNAATVKKVLEEEVDSIIRSS